ncbi:transcription antitermination factor NusB [Xylanivirga thermophila]|uniref:transcription antitermination factor NusB n=1 Tax=Xylanivirga thermophila TaxID=2496273 RepID=UPI00101CC670|nr:transcription antitermination factor NusB [Xylanivirga thermophila]
MSRRDAREVAMKIIYQYEFGQACDDDLIKEMSNQVKLSNADMEYLYDVVNGVKNNIVELDSNVDKFLKGWSLDRLAKIDLAILRLSIFEILYRTDVPNSVSINEAVELAKKYGTEKSFSFINGILASVVQHVQ